MPAIDVDSLIVEDRDAGEFKVHRSTMTSQEIFELERAEIFDKCWLYVGHESEVVKPGDFKRRNVGGRPIIFIHGMDGKIRALLNACTHRGAKICRQDSGNSRAFQCFYHSWTFDTTGDLIQVPDDAGYSECFDRGEHALVRPARFDNYKGLYFLNYDPNAEELVDYLADAKDYIDLILLDPVPNGVCVIEGTHQYSVKANWKLLCENAVDGYHGVALHSTYFDYLESYGTSGDAPTVAEDWVTVRDLGNGHSTLDYPSMGLPRPVAEWHPLFGEGTKDEIAAIEREVIERLGPERANRVCHHGKNMLIFPNLNIADGPGMSIRTIWPVSPDYMEVTNYALAGNGETPEQIRRRVDMFVTFLGPGGMASPDDVEALEACQEAFETQKELPWSDVSRGMHRQATMFDELQMRTFWRAWRARLQGNRPEGQIAIGGSEREPAEVAG